jgi:SMI1-KNR4 cell-wall
LLANINVDGAFAWQQNTLREGRSRFSKSTSSIRGIMILNKSCAQIWEELYAEIEVVDRENRAPISREFLMEFERQTGILLPKGYKEFMQIFGTGTFGSYTDFFEPSKSLSDEDLGYLIQDVRRMKERFEDLDYSEMEDLLEHSFAFAGTSKEETFAWDLNSYNDHDESYDIHRFHLGSNECYRVGRDFTEFVCGFCLGLNSFRFLPLDIYPTPINEIEFIWNR